MGPRIFIEQGPSPIRSERVYSLYLVEREVSIFLGESSGSTGRPCRGSHTADVAVFQSERSSVERQSNVELIGGGAQVPPVARRERLTVSAASSMKPHRKL